MSADQQTTGIEEAAQKIEAAWIASSRSLLRVEGWMGAGKSTVAKAVGKSVFARVIALDDYLTPLDEGAPNDERDYLRRIHLPLVRRVAREALAKAPKLIFEGVCLEAVLPSEEFETGFRVYVKRVSKQTGIWHDEFILEGERPDDGLSASVFDYHLKYRPHELCDMALAIPGD